MKKLMLVLMLMGLVGCIGGRQSLDAGAWEYPDVTKWDWKVEGDAVIRDGMLEVNGAGTISTTIDLSKYDGHGFTIELVAPEVEVDNIYAITFQLHYLDHLWGQDVFMDPVRNQATEKNKRYDLLAYTGSVRGKCELTLGIKGGKGRLKYDLRTFRQKLIPVRQQLGDPNYQATYPDYVKNRKPLKGMMTHTDCIPEDDIRTLASWGGKLARYQICMEYRGYTKQFADMKTDLERWWYRFDQHMTNLVEVLKWGEKYGVQIMIDMHNPPGNRYTKADAPIPEKIHDMKYYYEEELAEAYIKAWQIIANKFKGRKIVYGYDLINEPMQKPGIDAKYTFWEMQDWAIREIRKIDPDTSIIVSPNWGGGVSSFKDFPTFPYDNIIYQVHFYRPHSYTLQGWTVSAAKESADNFYPNPAKGFDIEYLRKELQPVRDFQLKHNAKIICGEWSVVQWAPGSDKFMRDSALLFDEYGWDWAYGCIREWWAWSIEHEWKWANDGKTRIPVPSKDNSRKRVMLEAFARQ